MDKEGEKERAKGGRKREKQETNNGCDQLGQVKTYLIGTKI